MTTANTSQAFQFRITGVSGLSFNARTVQNVKKRVESILYLQSLPADSIKLSYVGSNSILPESNLFIGDRSDALYANSRTGTIQEFTGVGTSVSVKHKNFIVTQEFNEAESGRIPLYYNHILDASPSNIIAESIRLYDKDFNLISADKYKVSLQQEYDEDTGLPESPAVYTEYHIYNNLQSSFNQLTGEYEVYFVQYTELIAGAETTRTILLNNKKAYREAVSEDIWHLGNGEVKPWVKAYTWDPGNLSLELPRVLGGNYAVKYEEVRRVSVDKPVALDDTSPWFPRIREGAFTSGYDGASLIYSIPEFENQAFNPIEPYKTAVLVECTKISDNLVKLPHEEIQSGSLFSYFYLVAELDGVIQYAVTDDLLKAGTEYKDLDNQRVYDSDGDTILWSSANLYGVDSLSGITQVGFTVKDSYKIYATYSYLETYYELTSLNMNPLFDVQAHLEVRAIYIVPESTFNNNIGAQTESVRWVKVSPSGLINATNQDNVTGRNENLDSDVALASSSGYRLAGVIGLYYNRRATTTTLTMQEVVIDGTINVSSASTFPYRGWIRFQDSSSDIYRYAYYIDKTDTTLVLSSSTDEVPDEASGIFIAAGATIELVNFVDERTTFSNRIADTELLHVSTGTFPVSHSRYFLLADMSINPSHSRQDAVVIDIREDGGGIDAETYEEAKQKQPQIQWYNDFNDFRGQPYPGNAVVVVKLPATILDSFTEQQVEQIVEQNVPFGIQSIIRYYGYEPQIISVLPRVEVPS